MRRKIRKDRSGQYSTDKGWTFDGKKRVQHRFYLGRDVHEARRREKRLASWWDAAAHGNSSSDRGRIDAKTRCWEPWSMLIAQQIAKGTVRDFILPSMPDWFEGDWRGYLEVRLAILGIGSSLPDSHVMQTPVEKKKKLTFKERRMAVLSDHFNVSQWIRDYKQANPNATNTEIIKAGDQVTTKVHTCGRYIEIGLRLDYQKVGNALKALKKGATCPFCGRTVATKRGKFLPHKASSLPRQSDPLCEGSRTHARTE